MDSLCLASIVVTAHRPFHIVLFPTLPETLAGIEEEIDRVQIEINRIFISNENVYADYERRAVLFVSW